MILICASDILAQDSLTVTESGKKFSKGMSSGFSVKIPFARLKDVKSDWKKYLHQKGKINPKENDGEIVLPQTLVSEISSDSVLLYSIINANPDVVELTVFAGKNDSVFYSTSSEPKLADGLQTFIRNFAVNEYKNAMNDQLTVEQKKLKILDQNLSDLENDNDRYEKKIKSNERIIDKTVDEIKTNKDLQELKSSTILQQQKVLATYLTPSDQKSDEMKKLKALEKEKKKLEKEEESLHKDIEDKKDDIKVLKRQIDLNNSEKTPAKKKEIEKQKEVIAGVEIKLKNIK